MKRMIIIIGILQNWFYKDILIEYLFCVNSGNKIKLIIVLFYSVKLTLLLINSSSKIKLVIILILIIR